MSVPTGGDALVRACPDCSNATFLQFRGMSAAGPVTWRCARLQVLTGAPAEATLGAGLLRHGSGG
jgi:hypothetical protein